MAALVAQCGSVRFILRRTAPFTALMAFIASNPGIGAHGD